MVQKIPYWRHQYPRWGGSGHPLEIDNDELKAIIEVNPLKTTREVAMNSTSIIQLSFAIWSKLERWKAWQVGATRTEQKSKESTFWSVLFIAFVQQQVHCHMRWKKWIFHDNWRCSAQWLQHDEPPWKFPKPKCHQKKVMVTVWWSAAGLIHHSFLNLDKTITLEKYCQHINEMHQKLQCICLALAYRKGPILLYDNARQHAEVEWAWVRGSAYIHHFRKTSHQQTTTSSSTLPTSCREKCFANH